MKEKRKKPSFIKRMLGYAFKAFLFGYYFRKIRDIKKRKDREK
jgi:hypothetical protein